MSLATSRPMETPAAQQHPSNRLRLGAIGAVGVLTAAYLSVLFHVTSVVTGTTRLAGVVLVAFVGAIAAAKVLDTRQAGIVTAATLVIGLAMYLVVGPGMLGALGSLLTVLRDILALMSGYTVLSIIAVDVWAMAVAPGPVFLSWYLAVRERYAPAVTVGLVPLMFFVLTGDAGTLQALGGAIAAAAAVGFGELSLRDPGAGESDLVVIILAAMLVTSLGVSVVPATGAQPIAPGIATEDDPTSTERSLLGGGEVTVSGNPTLDPTVRFTITAEEERNWRVDAYDRYTGDGWVQTGEPDEFTGAGELDEGQTVQMTARPELDELEAIPAHWRPTHVAGVTQVTQSPADGLYATEGLAADQNVTVTSSQPNATAEELREAGTDYPAEIEERYTQMPESTPDRVGELTADLVADAESPYEAAVIIEQYIIQTNEYSLDVDAPDGDIADAQLFERDAGYCTFFATTMVAMLRTQDIPARMVTGYSSGERVAEDRWVVRGMNAHAWVEMYVPEIGWVEFDPTPSAPYDDWRAERLEEAREEGIENVDTDETGGEEWEPEVTADDLPDNDTEAENASVPEARGTGELEACEDPQAITAGTLTEQEALAFCTQEQVEAMGLEAVEGEFRIDHPGAFGQEGDLDRLLEEYTMEEGPADDDEDGVSSPVPVDQLLFALALVVGGIAGARRYHVPDRIRHVVGVHWQGRSRDAGGATERAWRRLERHMAARYGGRRTGESARAYVRRIDAAYDLDERAMDVVGAYEQARYSDAPITPERARRVVGQVDGIVGSRRPNLDRMRR